MRTGWVEGCTYLSPRGVRNFNKYLPQACQNREVVDGWGWGWGAREEPTLRHDRTGTGSSRMRMEARFCAAWWNLEGDAV